jgi:type IV pilus assembly protein PilN
MANINLLPWREKLREERKQLFFIQLGITVAIAAVVVVALHLVVKSSIDNQSEVNTTLRNEIATLDGRLTEIRQLQEQKKALTARMAVIQELQGNRPVIVRLFDELVRTLPDGVYYNSITRTNDSIALEGIADSNSRISALMRDLEASEWFADPNLLGVSAVNGSEAGGQQNSKNKFQLTVKVTTPIQEK